MSEMVKLTGLWKQKDKEGKSFLTGNLNPISKVLVLQNNYKKNDTEPDYFLYLTQNEKKQSSNTHAREEF